MSIPVRYSPVALPFGFTYYRDKDGVAKRTAIGQINEIRLSNSRFIEIAVDTLYSFTKLYNLPLEKIFRNGRSSNSERLIFVPLLWYSPICNSVRFSGRYLWQRYLNRDRWHEESAFSRHVHLTGEHFLQTVAAIYITNTSRLVSCTCLSLCKHVPGSLCCWHRKGL